MPVPEVHQQKRQVIDHIDTGNLVVELDTVEQRRLTVQQDDVAEVQVAVTLANETGPPPPVEEIAAPLERCLRIAGDAHAQRFVDPSLAELRKTRRVAVDDPGHGPGAAVIEAPFSGHVKPGDGFGERGHAAKIERPERREPVEQQRLIESIHLDEPLDDPVSAAERQPVAVTAHRQYATVQSRRRPPVQPDFVFARDSSTLEGGEIDVVETDCPLELVSASARKKNDSGMGVDALDRLAAVGRGRSEEVNDC